MKRCLIALIVLILTAAASAQVERIVIPAGTPEDQAVQAINAENDAAKKTAMWQDFLAKFTANPQAVAFGNWQLSQQAQTDGDLAKALDYGTKAVAAQPNNLDILVSVAGIAQQLKKLDVVFDCAAKGAAAFDGIPKQTRPEGISDDDFAQRIKSDQDAGRQNYDYLEVSAFNSAVSEPDSAKKIGYIERFLTAFPSSKYAEQMGQLAVVTLSEMKDPARLESFGDKLLKANPNNLATLVLLASTFVEQESPAALTKAEGYARKALEVAKTPPAGLDAAKVKLYTGLAHSALGFSLLKQNKMALAIPELKAGSTELKEDAQSYSAVLYRLGYAYVKSNNGPAAKTVLKEAVEVDGPYKDASKDLLAKVEAAMAKKK